VSAVVRVITEFLFLCTLTLVPGELFLRSLAFSPRRSVDRLLAALAVSVAYVSVAVTLLLLLHVYARVTAGLILVIPIVTWWRARGGAAAATETQAPETETRQPEPIDRGVMGAAALSSAFASSMP